MASRPLRALLLLLVASAVLARPNDAEGHTQLEGRPQLEEHLPPTLDITSSVLLGHPLLGDTLGPFSSGIDVQLICSSRGGSLVLSWWEGGEELESQDFDIGGDQGIGRSITLEALSVSDSGRRLTCKAEETEVEKTVLLQVEKDDELHVDTSDSLEIEETASLEETGTLDILVNEQSMEEDQVYIHVNSGELLKLTCVLQGYNPPNLSWLENGLEMEAQSGKSSYATSSVLTVTAVSALDSGRRLLCRSEDGSQERVVVVQVYEDDYTMEALQIFLICICVGGILLIIVMAAVVVRLVKDYKQAVRGQQVSKVSDLFRKYSRLPNVNGLSRDTFAPQLVRGPYKPCTILLDPEGNEY